MNTKPIPITITLIASLIACVISIFEGVEFSTFVTRFGLTALIFYILGSLIRVFMDRSLKPEEEENEEETEQEQVDQSEEEHLK